MPAGSMMAVRWWSGTVLPAIPSAEGGTSPYPEAPPFRDLHRRYPIESLAEALAEGISTGHPAMPEFVATPTQIDAILSYIKSLSGRKP